MTPSERIPAGFSEGTPIFDRLKAMLGQHDMRVFLSDAAYVDVGSGSLGVTKQLTEVPAGYAGRLGTIGRFCEFSDSAKIVVHGEHDNDRLVNVSFGGFPILKGRNGTAGKPFAPFEIGNGVVASTGAVVLSGRTVGDGVVLGASSVVTRDLEPNGIYAGVPARRLRDRPKGAAWWNFDIAYLMSNIDNIEAVAADVAANHVYRRPSPRIAVKLGQSVEVLGAMDGETLVSFSRLPDPVRNYIVQAMTSERPYWVADCWA